MENKDLKKISDVVWEIPKSFRADMRVPARVYASEKMLKEVFRDRSLSQLVNVSTLPGIQSPAMVMPDAHEGYGFPIGGVAAMAWPDGVISPGGIGFDLNCGVRLLRSDLRSKDIKPYVEKLAHQIFRDIPPGVGRGGRHKLSIKELDKVLKLGLGWALKNGFAEPEDPLHIESYGTLPNADPDAVSDYAKKRGHDQLGTMGAGNHFVEIDRVDHVFLPQIARAFGLYEDQIVVLMHTGSRGLGHQVCTDYLKTMGQVMPKYGIRLPDPQLACVPFSSPEGARYFNAMAAAANFAWTNRQMMTWAMRDVWQRIFGKEGGALTILYDVAHNLAKIEEHEIEGQKKKVIVHRKGATRAFGPGEPELAKEFQKTGQPVLIPGSMGTASYVLVGTAHAMKESFGSSCHGAGRRMSRRQAKREVDVNTLRKDLEKQGIYLQAGSFGGAVEEAPQAYKDVHSVVDVVDQADIAKKVASLKPLIVIKG